MTPTPGELLASRPVQSINSTAIILQLIRKNGEPNRAAVHALIRSGAICIIDPDQPVHRWSVASAEIERYIQHGPRRGADILSFAERAS